MIIVTSLNQESENYSRLVPYEDRIKYRSFLDILNSISVIDKYVVDKSANYSHEYDDTRMKNIDKISGNKVLEKRKIELDYTDVINNRRFSKEIKKVIDNDTIKMMEYGTKIHENLEYAKLEKGNNTYIDNLLDKIDNNFINVYKEYEFMYLEQNELLSGVIDLILEYKEYISIIDYKLNNLDDANYIKQLKGYKKYIESITDKRVDIYLYSVLSNELKKI